VIDLRADPIEQFLAWRGEAAPFEPDPWTSMTLATADGDGVPSARTVLLKGVDERGFTFFTNYESRKGRELAANPHAALVFRFREPRHRQVLVRGTVETLPEAESDEYFATRPRDSQIGAWASPQSSVIASRDELDSRVAAVVAQFPGDTVVPRPPHWGGYLVRPVTVELWEERPHRLHERHRYRHETGGWKVERLAP
jgi:pyridoxamine 5'-phosphate oxidase